MVNLTTRVDLDVLNSIYKFNVGYAVKSQTFAFTISLLANSPDIGVLRSLLDNRNQFTLTVKPAYANWSTDQFGPGKEILENCILISEDITIEVEGGAPVMTFRGYALRKTLYKDESTKMYTVGSGVPTIESNTDPFAWLNGGG